MTNSVNKYTPEDNYVFEQCINSIYKLITVVHSAILYNQRLPIDTLYIRTTDRHFYKCYARLYYIVTGEYLYCDKLTIIVNQSRYNSHPTQITTHWPRYWLIEMGTFDIINNSALKFVYVHISNKFVNVYLSGIKHNYIAYHLMSKWYGINLSHLVDSFPDTIPLDKSALPITVRPSHFTSNDLSWYTPTYEIYLNIKIMTNAVNAAMPYTAPAPTSGDEIYTHKNSKFRINRIKK